MNECDCDQLSAEVCSMKQSLEFDYNKLSQEVCDIKQSLEEITKSLGIIWGLCFKISLLVEDGDMG